MENKLVAIKVIGMSSLDSNKYGIKLISWVCLSLLNLNCNMVFSSPASSAALSRIQPRKGKRKKNGICKMKSHTHGVNQVCFKGDLKSYTPPAWSLWRLIRSVLDALRQIRVPNTLLQLVNSGGTHIIRQLLNYRLTQTDNRVSGCSKFPTVTVDLTKYAS